MFQIGFIDYFLDEWHANNYPVWISKASEGRMAVTHAYALIDSPRDGGRTTEAWCADFQVKHCKTIEEIISACDGLIVLSPDNCEMHETLCQLPLRSGLPVYVDKTFSPDLDSARRILDIAEQNGTPCYSTSALRYADEYASIVPGTPISIDSKGPGVFENYSIHQLEPLIMLMDAPAHRVKAHMCGDKTEMTIEFIDGRVAHVTCDPAAPTFSMRVQLQDGITDIQVSSDYFGAFIRQLVHFFDAPHDLVRHADTLRIMAVRGAGIDALRAPDVWTYVPESSK